METAKKTPQGLIMEYNWAQKLYDETLDLKDTTEELIAYMALDRVLGRENEQEEPIENIEKYNKVASEWEKDLKQRLDEITKKYKELTGRDIKEDLEIEWRYGSRNYAMKGNTTELRTHEQMLKKE